MSKLLIFTDGSVSESSKIGFGAGLVISEDELLDENLSSRIRIKRFENTSSTRLELQNLLWVFSTLNDDTQQVIVYTDSQNIPQLLKRRERIEAANYHSKKGIRLNNADLYKAFYHYFDAFDCEIIKLQGHQPTHRKNEIERVFTLVDKASRKALRFHGAK